MTPPSAAPIVITVTAGEREALAHLAWDGADNERIGWRLGVSTAAVAKRISTALGKTPYVNRTELAVALIRGRIKLRVTDGRPR